MNKAREAPIGVFDSGIGGLTVAREIMRQIPQERIVYFGDTAPPALRQQEPQYDYPVFPADRPLLKDAAGEGHRRGLQYGQRLRPGHPAAGIRHSHHRRCKARGQDGREGKPGGNIGVIGTAGTVGSHIYRDYIESLRPDAKVFEKACPCSSPWWRRAGERIR